MASRGGRVKLSSPPHLPPTRSAPEPSRECCSCSCPRRSSACSRTGSFAAAGTAPPRTIWSLTA